MMAICMSIITCDVNTHLVKSKMPQRFNTNAVMKPVLFKLTCTGQREDNNERKHERAKIYLKHPENDIQGQI